MPLVVFVQPVGNNRFSTPVDTKPRLDCFCRRCFAAHVQQAESPPGRLCAVSGDTMRYFLRTTDDQIVCIFGCIICPVSHESHRRTRHRRRETSAQAEERAQHGGRRNDPARRLPTPWYTQGWVLKPTEVGVSKTDLPKKVLKGAKRHSQHL